MSRIKTKGLATLRLALAVQIALVQIASGVPSGLPSSIMPQETFLSYTLQTDSQALFAYVKDMIKAFAPDEESFDKGLAKLNEKVLGGKDLEKDLKSFSEGKAHPLLDQIGKSLK